MDRGWGSSFQVAAVYVGTVVGAGFATGREIVEFFTKYGFIGIIGITIAGCFFIWIGTKMMIVSKRINATSYQDLNIFLFGRSIGKVVNLLMLIVLIGVTSVMLSGAGAIFEEQLQLSKQVGVIITVLLTLFVMAFGVQGLLSVNVIVVPMLILFSLIVAFQSIGEHTVITTVTDEFGVINWIVSALSYAGFNLTMAAAVLVPLAAEMKDEKVLKRGGILGGILLTVILIGSHISLATLADVSTYDVPMAELMRITFFSFFFIYVLVIYGEVFTSVIGNLFGLEKQILQIVHLPRMIVIACILVIAIIISQFGYSSLLSILYPLFGKVSLVVLALLIIKRIPKQQL
ncbi:YkvI family membrane protein [Metabacillus fastidiosus]|uniref:YkvI family membrane protein n=1 Tax=Metabacillus fastidiosus TaxID=1458 RepID=UPI003D27A927